MREAVRRQTVSVGTRPRLTLASPPGSPRFESGSSGFYSWDFVTDATERLYLRLRGVPLETRRPATGGSPCDEEPLAGPQGDVAVIHRTVPRLCVTADGGATSTTTP
jgi:hypothetical protein